MLTRKRSFRNNLCVEVFSVQPVSKQSDVWVSSVELCPEPIVLLKDVVTGTAAVGGPATGQGSLELVAQTQPVNEYEHLNQSPDNSSAPEHSIVTYTNNTCKKPNAQSFPFPNGLEMDPLAPTALVVPDFMDRIGSGLMLLRDHGKKVQKMMWKNKKLEPVKKSTKTLVSIVLVEAKNIPNGLANGSNGLYCKFKLGTESHKSKQVQQAKPTWCEKFNMHLYNDGNLEITMWHKGKQKLFMGRCIVDLSKLSKDRSHDLWQDLGCGHGSIHIVVTMNSTTDYALYDHIPTNAQRHEEPVKEKYSWYKLNDSWDEVGELTITVMGARSLCPPGLIKADAYCVVELDNARVQTHTVWGSQEPYWNKTYVFPIYDITSALEISVFDDSLIRPLLGQLTLPLLRINNDEDRWYALKDKSNKSVARGNLAKIQLKMTLNWNPIKASIRVLSPKQEKYTEKTEKFNIPLIYYNLKFIREIFNFIQDVHEKYKLMLEWDDPKMNILGLMVWCVFWFSFRQWMTPLLLVIPFIYHAVLHHHSNYQSSLLIDSEDDIEKDEKTLKTKILGLQDLTLKIKRGIDFIVTLLEKIQNLTTFEVPYLSYLAIIALLALSVAFYVLPINYILMLFGVYKFSRKFLNPDRIPNNDLLDFISRVPDNVTLSQWKELKVVESNGGGKNGR